MAELVYYCGTMDSGKSTLALQTAHNHQSRGRSGLLFTNRDRAGSGKISSRLGLTSEALEVSEDLDLHRFVVEQLSTGAKIDYAAKLSDYVLYTTKEILIEFIDINILPKLKKH